MSVNTSTVHNADAWASFKNSMHLFDESRSAMSLTTAAKVEVLGVLVRAGREARAALTPEECNVIVETSAQVAAIAPTLPDVNPGDRGRAARAAIVLFLSVDCPSVDGALCDEVARAVEYVVLRHRATAGPR